MRTVFAVISLLILCATAQAQLVSNTGTTGEDSITLYVQCLDSVGNLSTCDSFYVRVFKSGADAVHFSDSGTCAGMSTLDSASGKSHYYYHNSIANIDGAGVVGNYTLVVIAKKIYGSGWTTPNVKDFQIMRYAPSVAWDSTGLAAKAVSGKTFPTAVASAAGVDSLRAGTATVTLTAGQFTKIKDTAQIGTYTLAAGQFTKVGDTSAVKVWGTGTKAVTAIPAATLAAGEYTKIKDTAQIGTYTLAAGQFTKVGDTAAVKVWATGTKAVTAIPTATLTAGEYTKIGDTALLKIGTPLKPSDTDELRNNIVTALGIPLKPSDTDELRANIIAAFPTVTLSAGQFTKIGDTALLKIGTPLKPSDTDELRNNIVTAIGIPLKPSDTDELRGNIIAAMTVPLKPSDTDELRGNIVAAIGLTAARQAKVDSITNIFLALDSLQDTTGAIYAGLGGGSNWSNAQRDSILALVKSGAELDSASLKRWAGIINDSASAGSGATAAEVLDAIKSDSVGDTSLAHLIAGYADSGVAATVDTASLARSVWDNDVVARANRTVDEIDTAYFNIGCDTTPTGDFLLTLGNYRDQIKRKMGVATTNTTWITDTTLNEILREAIVTINPIMRGYKTTKVLVSRFDSSDYPLDSLVGISSVLWYKDDTARSIPYLAREKWATLTTQNTYGASDAYLERPQVYDYTDANISFFPVPTSEDSIKIYGWSKISNITTVASVSQIPQKYRVAILKYAAFLVARSKQHPLVQTFLDEYKESIVFLAGVKAEDAKK